MHHPDCPRSDPTRSNAPCLCWEILRTEDEEDETRLLRGMVFGILFSLPFWLIFAWVIL